ncbi:uroporphyrinogen-III synthase [Sphingosinicella rhizophila]|uniref:Uroporphyrinogen-III synthase n=1 Tax=Sphingosinicella rhizophila TaxID=3050082 RepID=A0ABU3Q860_9SPHN|nr:uroporphyrinogen-III synthase [Sphingosinicella sp. GR2756]MDT9599591.1 uroporphyrinogen-III synthase [Sphingosinicella sp. GR2756]
MRPVLILRPEPGASDSAERAEAIGLISVTAPLFTVRPLSWQAPDPHLFAAVLLTSANAARHGGDGLAAYRDLPCYTVGEATAAAARDAGFRDIRVGEGAGEDAVRLAAGDGARHILHLCGRDHKKVEAPGVSVTRLPVYAADAIDGLPGEALQAIRAQALILLHSARAASHFGRLLDQAGLARSDIELAAISAAAARAAGGCWRAKHIAAAPRDDALLELAAKLCHIPAMSMGSRR